jgi:hypothetical protein
MRLRLWRHASGSFDSAKHCRTLRRASFGKTIRTWIVRFLDGWRASRMHHVEFPSARRWIAVRMTDKDGDLLRVVAGPPPLGDFAVPGMRQVARRSRALARHARKVSHANKARSPAIDSRRSGPWFGVRRGQPLGSLTNHSAHCVGRSITHSVTLSGFLCARRRVERDGSLSRRHEHVQRAGHVVLSFITCLLIVGSGVGPRSSRSPRPGASQPATPSCQLMRSPIADRPGTTAPRQSR